MSLIVNTIITTLILVTITILAFTFINWVAETVNDILRQADNNNAYRLLNLILVFLVIIIAYILYNSKLVIPVF